MSTDPSESRAADLTEDVEPVGGLSFPQADGTWAVDTTFGWREGTAPEDAPSGGAGDTDGVGGAVLQPSASTELVDPSVPGTGATPAPVDEISEDYTPAGGFYQPRQDPQGKEPTRRILAWALVGILVLLVLVGCTGWLLDGGDTDRMQNFGLIFAPVVTLVGTMLAFYFSSDDK